MVIHGNKLPTNMTYSDLSGFFYFSAAVEFQYFTVYGWIALLIFITKKPYCFINIAKFVLKRNSVFYKQRLYIRRNVTDGRYNNMNYSTWYGKSIPEYQWRKSL